MFLSAKKPCGPIAIDVGAAGVRALQVERRNGKLAVRHWTSLPLPLPAAGKNGQNPAEISTGPPPPELNRDAFVGNEVVVAISPPDVECTPLRVPENVLKLERKALLAAIRHEVSRNINLPIDGVEMDVWPLVPGHTDSPNLMVAAARRETIARVLAWLDRQGLVCRRIDVGPLAVTRTCSRSANHPADNQLWGVLDLGQSAVRLYIGLGETPVYVRCMDRGGEEMTRRISEELGVDTRVAESYKRHYGVQASTAGDGHYRVLASADDTVDSRRMAGILLGVLRPILRSIGEEVQRSFHYAMGLYPDRPIGGLWLVGDGANMAGLPDMLEQMLGIGLHRLTAGELPPDLIVPPSMTDEAVPRLAICVGLSLGEICP